MNARRAASRAVSLVFAGMLLGCAKAPPEAPAASTTIAPTTSGSAPAAAASVSAAPLASAAPVSTEVPEVVPLPRGDAATLSAKPPPVPKLEESQLVSPPFAWTKDCSGTTLPPVLLEAPRSTRRHPGSCVSTTYQNDEPHFQHVDRYDTLGRLAVSFTFEKIGSKFELAIFKRLDRAPDGTVIGWADDDGKYRCKLDGTRGELSTIDKKGKERLVAVITRDESGRPVEVSYPRRSETSSWVPGSKSEKGDTDHAFAYDPKSRTVRETMSTTVAGNATQFVTFTSYREDGQRESMVSQRNGKVYRWGHYDYDADGNATRSEERDDDGTLRVTVYDYGCFK